MGFVRAVTDEEVSIYRRDGVVQLRQLVSPEGIAAIEPPLRHQLGHPSEWVLTGTHQSDRCFGLDDPTLRSYVLDPVLGSNAARAMKSTTARFFFDHLFAFEPDSPLPDHYWHQDIPYWPVDGEHVVSFWLSLVPCTPETSALKFVRGSHHDTQLYRPNGFDGAPLSGTLGDRGRLAVDVSDNFRDEGPPPFHEDPDRYDVLEFSYEPGDAVMFHSRVVHSSGGNSSPDTDRLAYSVRFVGDDAHMMLRQGVFQDPALLPDADEEFAIGAPMVSRKWPQTHPASGVLGAGA